MKRYTDILVYVAPFLFVAVLLALAFGQYLDARAELDRAKADASQSVAR